MGVEINYGAILAAALVAMAAGLVWYSNPLFGRTWMRIAKIDAKKMKREAPKSMLIMALFALIMSYVLAHVTYLSSFFFLEVSFQGAAFSSAFWLWFGFVLPVIACNNMFNQAKSPWQLTAIQAGYWLVALLGMGAVIGYVGL